MHCRHTAGTVGGGAWTLQLSSSQVTDNGLAALGREGGFVGGFAVAQAPIEKRIMNEGFQYRHQGLFIVANNTHDRLASNFVAAVDVADFHRKGEHTSKTERNTFRVFLAVHGYLEAITEIDVDDLARNAVEHQVRRVAIAKPQNVADHGHCCEGACEVGSTVEPRFGALALKPEDTVEIFTSGVVHCVAKYFDLLHKSEIIVVWCHLQHNSVLDVEQDTTVLTVLLDQVVQGIAILNPAQKA